MEQLLTSEYTNEGSKKTNCGFSIRSVDILFIIYLAMDILSLLKQTNYAIINNWSTIFIITLSNTKILILWKIINSTIG